MPRFCTSCGKEIPDGVAFCTECGTPAPAEEAAATTEIKNEPPKTAPLKQTNTPPIQPQPTVRQPAPAVDAPPAGKYGVVGTGYFFGMMFLFAIPVIGWLACLIMAFAPKNKNIKHYARAMMIWLIIGLVFAVVGYFVFRWLGGVLLDYINQATDGAFGEWGDLFEQFKEFQNVGISGLPSN